ncbi:MAG: N-acetylmuramoyl-L-alanine amidase [Verrucomicrobiales bacterium]|jgi:N-acetylmuramoyl-L-alanine amidase|nr:N-acetylmuramoyl-L-alanine amidase [Verrucomicrobiales bacterium]
MPVTTTRYFLFALFLACLPLQGAEDFDRVVIDPGHGGKDPGSHAYGLVEKNLTLDLAKRLEKILKAKGLTTELTRRSDVFVELEDRAAKANQKKRTIFISLHFNGHTDRSIGGTETLYWPGSDSGRVLASYIQSELGRRLVTRNRGFKPERLKVLEATHGTAVLVECGFITNRWESQRSGAEWFRQILAEEIAQGILRYRKN